MVWGRADKVWSLPAKHFPDSRGHRHPYPLPQWKACIVSTRCDLTKVRRSTELAAVSPEKDHRRLLGGDFAASPINKAAFQHVGRNVQEEEKGDRTGSLGGLRGGVHSSAPPPRCPSPGLGGTGGGRVQARVAPPGSDPPGPTALFLSPGHLGNSVTFQKEHRGSDKSSVW